MTVSMFVLVTALQTVAAPTCEITIAEPSAKEGFPAVADAATARGSAKLPPDLYFWVFAQQGRIDANQATLGAAHGNPSTLGSHTMPPGFSGAWTTQLTFLMAGKATNSIWTIRAMGVDAQNHKALTSRINGRQGSAGILLKGIKPHCEARLAVETGRMISAPELQQVRRSSPAPRNAVQPAGAHATSTADCSDTQPIADIVREAELYMHRDDLGQALARYKCAHSRLSVKQQRLVRAALPVTFWQGYLPNAELRVAVDSAQRVFRSLAID